MSAEPIHELAAYVPVSQAMLEDLRPHKPTDAEHAQWRAEAAARAEHDKTLRSRYAELRAKATGPLRKIMELHGPTGQGATWFMCGECVDSQGTTLDWPCATARLALELDE